MLSDLCEFTKIFGVLKKNAKDIFENIKNKRLVTQKKIILNPLLTSDIIRNLIEKNKRKKICEF